MSDDFFKAFNKELGGLSAPSQDSIPTSENTAAVPQQAMSAAPVAFNSSQSATPSVQTTSSGQQVPASWLIIAAAVGAGIVIIAELILK
jgi:hypothetical protein